MTAVRLPRPAALATVLVLLAAAIVAFPREAHGQIGGRVLNPNGVTPTASTVLVTIKGADTPESTRPALAGRFSFPTLAPGTRVTVQAMAQGLISKPVTATAPDTMVVVILGPTRAGEKFDIVQQGTQPRQRAAAPATPAPAAAPATPAAASPAPSPAEQAAPQPTAEAPAPAQAPTQAQAPAQAQAATQAQGQGPTVRQQAAGNGGVNAQGLAVQEALFTTAELVDRAPASVGGCTAAACATRYADTVGTVTFWTRLSGGAPGRWVEHVWFHDEKEIARVRQKVEGPTWRTWTRKRIDPEWTGDWRVEVRAEDGTVLAERFFTIEQP